MAATDDALLADGNIDAVNRFARLKSLALVDYGVYSDSSLADLTVTDDQLTLSTAYRHHRVYGLDTGLQRLLHRLAVDHSRCLALKRQPYKLAVDRLFAVDRLAEHIDDTSQQTLRPRG